jgi:hypothetical protein
MATGRRASVLERRFQNPRIHEESVHVSQKVLLFASSAHEVGAQPRAKGSITALSCGYRNAACVIGLTARYRIPRPTIHSASASTYTSV